VNVPCTFASFSRPRHASPPTWLPGDRVAIRATNEVEFVEVLLAALHLGAIAVPVTVRKQRPEILDPQPMRSSSTRCSSPASLGFGTRHRSHSPSADASKARTISTSCVRRPRVHWRPTSPRPTRRLEMCQSIFMAYAYLSSSVARDWLF